MEMCQETITRRERLRRLRRSAGSTRPAPLHSAPARGLPRLGGHGGAELTTPHFNGKEWRGGSGCVAGWVDPLRPSRQGHPLMARVRLHRLCLHLNPSSSLPLPNTVPQCAPPTINSGPFLRTHPHPLSRPTPQPHLVCGECDSRAGGAGPAQGPPTATNQHRPNTKLGLCRWSGSGRGGWGWGHWKGYTSRTTREFYWCSSAQQSRSEPPWNKVR